jgi:hypothetical protein
MTRLQEVTELDANLIKFARLGTKIPFSGDRDIILRFTRPRPYDGLMTGAPEYGMQAAVTRALHVQIRTRTAFGVSDRDDAWLMDDVFGHYLLEDLVLTAMIPFRPYILDEDDDTIVYVLTVDDVLLVDGSEYRDEFKQIPPDDPTWGVSELIFRVNYVVQSEELDG